MTRKALVYVHDHLAGELIETEEGTYTFSYSSQYLEISSNLPVSLTLPLQKEPFESKTLFPFFDGLIPEGWLLDLSSTSWKINPKDRMGLLLEACYDCIGSVSIRQMNEPR